MKILMVEDQLLIAMEQHLYLEEAGHEVFGPAMDLDQALEAMQDGPFDLALVDVHLANGSSGLDVARHLKAGGTPCLFITAFPEDVVGLQLGLGCLMKPFTRGDLLATVDYFDPGTETKAVVPRNLVLFGRPA